MVDINSLYTGEIIQEAGKDYEVLDTSREKISFDNNPNVKFGKKTTPTQVRIAKPGEIIVTSQGKENESTYTATGGEIVFINQLAGGVKDEFVPRDNNGKSNGDDILAEKYDLIGGDRNSAEGAVYIPKGAAVKILHEAVTKPACIKDAWGLGQHQFLETGATLRENGARATGINKTAFDQTWDFTDAAGRVLSIRRVQAQR